MKIFCSSENNVKIFYRLTAGSFPGSLPKPRQSVLQIGLSAVFFFDFGVEVEALLLRFRQW